MKILSISGSSRSASSNVKLLDSLPKLYPKYQFQHKKDLHQLPLFRADDDHHPLPTSVLKWRNQVAKADAVIICTPEYIHNMPALLKNALEWLTSSGELAQKAVLAITFTPHPPRGKKAMQSLLWSLQALEARIVGQLDLYQNEISFDEQGIQAGADILELLTMSMDSL